MVQIVWTSRARNIFQKWIRRHPNLKGTLLEKLKLFENDPFQKSLKTHQLSGKLDKLWAFRINHRYRVIFRFINNSDNEVQIISIGTHDEVY